MNWSGGKDSALALHRVLQNGELEVAYLLTSIDASRQEISMHGVRRELLRRQADQIGIELVEMFLPEMPAAEVYEHELNKTLDFLVSKGVTHSIFGDIFLEDLRAYREKQLKAKNITAVFPLWQKSTARLIEEFIDLKFEAVTVCVDAAKLGAEFCGKTLDLDFVRSLPPGVDVCGENGEFHTFVCAAPFFANKINIKVGEIFRREYQNQSGDWSSNFYYCDLSAEIK